VTDRFTRAWFRRSAPEVAVDLLGRDLLHIQPSGERRRVRIVETEAYEPDDPASHSFRGPTPRAATMFGQPGRLYVYLIYGVHHCLNIVTGPAGHGAAVLLRAGRPLEGLEGMAVARGTDDPRALCSGPGKLAEALGLGVEADGADLLGRGPVRLLPGRPVLEQDVERGPRVGIRRGRAHAWRFAERGTPWRSAPSVTRLSRASRP
jgi:DNA-3-methyladenine glycosylase